jgi:hypothetical protein
MCCDEVFELVFRIGAVPGPGRHEHKGGFLPIDNWNPRTCPLSPFGNRIDAMSGAEARIRSETILGRSTRAPTDFAQFSSCDAVIHRMDQSPCSIRRLEGRPPPRSLPPTRGHHQCACPHRPPKTWPRLSGPHRMTRRPAKPPAPPPRRSAALARASARRRSSIARHVRHSSGVGFSSILRGGSIFSTGGREGCRVNALPSSTSTLASG